MPARASSSRNSGTQAKRRVDGEDVGAGDSRSSPRVQFAPFAVQLLCSVQSDDAAAVPFSSVQLVHFTSLKHAAQHVAVVLHANDGASLPTLLEQHVPLVVCKLPHDAVLLTAAAAAPVTSSVCTSASRERMPRKSQALKFHGKSWTKPKDVLSLEKIYT